MHICFRSQFKLVRKEILKRKLSVCPVTTSKQQQKPTHFLLKYNDDSDNTYTKELPQNRTQKLHFQGLYYQPNNKNDEYPHENIEGNCPFYQFINFIENYCNK